MADTKISDLPVAVSVLADADEFPVADASALTDDANVTAAVIKTYVNTAPDFAAGSSTAGSWPQVASGTVQTTPGAGTFPEYDGNAFYGTTDAGNRGYIPVRHVIRADSTRTFTSNTSSQAIFTSPTNGRLTLETGCYLFEGVLNIGSMSATSGNLLFNVLGGGTATMASVLFHTVGVDGATGTAATQTGSTAVTNSTPASALTAGTGTAATLHIRGSFEITAAGTIIPSITMVTAAASVLAVGSYLTFERIGSTSVVSIGQWD